MIIGIDGNEANVMKRVGVSVYTLNLLRYFQKHADSGSGFTVYLRHSPLPDLPKTSRYFRYEVVPGKWLWSQLFLPLRLYQKRKIDVFFSPAHYIPRFSPVPCVVTIHDLSYLYYPDDFLKSDLYKLTNWTKYSVNHAKKIVAVSKTTKKDIVKSYYLPEDKIEVIYNGYEKIAVKHSRFADEKIDDAVDKPFILYVGTLQPRKNIDTLIEAFAKLKQLYPQFSLIIAGKKGWLFDQIFDKVSNLGLNDDVFFTDYVTDNQLLLLYKEAFCFVMPSFYEGFGIPILEAMNHDCPVVSSFASSLPEVGGDACLYFDPHNIYDLVEKLKILKEDKNLRAELIKKGKERIKTFSWNRCGEETLKVIKDAAKNG